MFGRHVVSLGLPPRLLHELGQGLFRVWSSLPISMCDNLIGNMERRRRQCIATKGEHIPY